jgi:hypothetical protein
MGHCEIYENRMDARYEKDGGVATTMLDLTRNVGAKQKISDIFKKSSEFFFSELRIIFRKKSKI